MANFVLQHKWLDSDGREHARTVVKGSTRKLNKWARSKCLLFKRDRSLFGGAYLAPDGSWFEADVQGASMRK